MYESANPDPRSTLERIIIITLKRMIITKFRDDEGMMLGCGSGVVRWEVRGHGQRRSSEEEERVQLEASGLKRSREGLIFESASCLEEIEDAVCQKSSPLYQQDSGSMHIHPSSVAEFRRNGG
jgi:hypothetical protein